MSEVGRNPPTAGSLTREKWIGGIHVLAIGSSFDFVEREDLPVKQLLSGLKTKYPAHIISNIAQKALPEYFQQELGQLVAVLKNNYEMPHEDIEIDGVGVRFTDGIYSIEFEATDHKSGVLLRRVSLHSSWFADASLIPRLLKDLRVKPSEIVLSLRLDAQLKGLSPGMKAIGWKLESELAHEVQFSQGPHQLVIEKRSITFRGFLADEIFGSNATPQAKLAAGVLALLSPPK